MYEHYGRELCGANGPDFREATGDIYLFVFGEWLTDFVTGSTAVSLSENFK